MQETFSQIRFLGQAIKKQAYACGKYYSRYHYYGFDN